MRVRVRACVCVCVCVCAHAHMCSGGSPSLLPLPCCLARVAGQRTLGDGEDRVAWRATVHGVTKGGTRLSD